VVFSPKSLIENHYPFDIFCGILFLLQLEGVAIMGAVAFGLTEFRLLYPGMPEKCILENAEHHQLRYLVKAAAPPVKCPDPKCGRHGPFESNGNAEVKYVRDLPSGDMRVQSYVPPYHQAMRSP
jgi:hypothetical protein